MNFFSLEEVLISLLYSVIYGTVCGCLYKASARILRAIKKIFLFLFYVCKLSQKPTYKDILVTAKNNEIIPKSKIGKNIYEFILFLFFGTGLIILYYITLDSIFRVYIAITVVLFFFISKEFVGNIFVRVFDFLFNSVYFLLLYLFTFSFYPLHQLLAPLFRHIKTWFIKNNSSKMKKTTNIKEKAKILH